LGWISALIPRKFFRWRLYTEKLRLAFAKVIISTGRPLEVSTYVDNLRIKFIATSFLEYSFRARKSFDREKVTMHWLRTVLCDGDIIYDVGANVGAYSLYAAMKYPSCQVYAFEPAYANFCSLCENIKANYLDGRVIAYPLGIGRHVKPNKMFLRDTTAGSALHGLGAAESEGKEFEAKFTQGTFETSLDSFSKDARSDFPNHIKIDVDGGEGSVLDGMKNVLSDRRLRSIMVEVNHRVWGDRIEETIRKAGFELVQAEQLANGEAVNQLFVRD